TSIIGTRGSGASGMSALRPFPRAGRFSMMTSAEAGAEVTSAREITPRCALLRVPPKRRLRRRCCRSRQHLAREREIRFGATRFDVVENHRHAVARRLAEPDVARNDGTEDFLLEERADVAGHLVPEIRSIVEHREEHAFNVESGIERGADAAHRADEIREALE